MPHGWRGSRLAICRTSPSSSDFSRPAARSSACVQPYEIASTSASGSTGQSSTSERKVRNEASSWTAAMPPSMLLGDGMVGPVLEVVRRFGSRAGNRK